MKLALILLFAAALLAQMGSPGNGETQAIALHPTDPSIIYAGAGKGFCITRSGGKDNWPSSGLESYSPRAIVLDPGDLDIIYAGTYGMGVYKTTDGARTWKAANRDLTWPAVRALAMHVGALYAGTDGGGIFKTTDGASTWREANRGLIDKVVRALLIDPRNPSILYAATWHGVYKSSDAAATWSALSLYDIDVVALAFDPTFPDVLYAATNPRGVWRTSDAGRTWTQGREPLTEHLQSIAVDPANPTHVYAGTRAGVFRSADSGATFQPAGLQWSNSAWTLIFDGKTSPPTLYYGGVGGILKTANGGDWWDVTGPIRP